MRVGEGSGVRFSGVGLKCWRPQSIIVAGSDPANLKNKFAKS